jgi:hypothetical protein
MNNEQIDRSIATSGFNSVVEHSRCWRRHEPNGVPSDYERDPSQLCDEHGNLRARVR